MTTRPMAAAGQGGTDPATGVNRGSINRDPDDRRNAADRVTDAGDLWYRPKYLPAAFADTPIKQTGEFRAKSLTRPTRLRVIVAAFALALFHIPAAYAQNDAGETETWNAKFQSTYVWQLKPAFPAAYSGVNSLSPNREQSFSLSATEALGYRPWSGGEVYVDPEMISSKPLSNLTGLGGLTNGENQKGSGSTPVLYVARLFLRQTYDLGGEPVHLESASNQLAGVVDSQRLVVTAGDLAVTDLFDNNAYAHDPRTQFLNWSFLTYGAFDYAADTRGYTWGAAVEYYDGPWAWRFGRFMVPIESNGETLDTRLCCHYGDQFEVEHAHELGGEPGKLRFLVYRNRARMGRYLDALNYAAAHGTTPDVAQVRADTTKYGFGFGIEQALSPNLGSFVQESWDNGQAEEYEFAEIDRSLTGGIVLQGAAWGRPRDTFGLAAARNGLSSRHIAYLAAGGSGFFLGDGHLNYHPELIVESYYSLGVARQAWLSVDYQRIRNPGYNADRGPVSVYGLRVHVEL